MPILLALLNYPGQPYLVFIGGSGVTIQFAFRLVPLVLLAVTAWTDWRRRRMVTRHWSHWAGVLLGFSMMSLQFVVLLWIWITLHQS